MIVTFNRPKAMNSMPAAMHCELSKIFRYFDTNDELWVAIVTGTGRAFSAGFDLKSAAGLAPPEDTAIDVTTGSDLNICKVQAVALLEKRRTKYTRRHWLCGFNRA